MAAEGSLAARVRAGWPRISEVLDILAEAVTIRDRDGTIAYANGAALASMGFGSIEEMQQRSSRAIMDAYIVQDEHGNPLSIEDVPSMRMMHGEAGEPLLMRTIHRVTGETHWRQLKATPILDERGELVAAVTVIEDVTAVKTAEIRMRLLAESGRILASSLDYEQTLDNVANLAVPRIADWCAVDLIDSRLRREHTVVAYHDPAKFALAARVRAYGSAELEPDGTGARVLRSGVSELHRHVTDEQLEQGTHGAEHLALVRELGIRSAIVVPMQVPTRTIGVMTLVTAESGRQLGEDDLELAEQLARRAAVATENARLHTTLSAVANTLQQSLLPDELPEIPGWEVASLYRSAGGDQRIDVGGDFYELFPADDHWFAIIGDVTGKGIGAATLTSLLRHGSRFAGRHDPRPGGILRQLDEALRIRSGTAMCTALCTRLHEDRVVLSSAGHPPALRLAGDASVDEAPEAGPLLGAFEDASWEEQELPVEPGGMLLLYTDGVTDTSGVAGRFGTARLKALLAEHAGSSPDEFLALLDDTLDHFRDGARADDIAALALRPRPPKH